MDVGEDLLEQKVVIALEVDDLTFLRETIEKIDESLVLLLCIPHAPYQKIEDIPHQKELGSVKTLQKNIQLFAHPRMVVGIADKNGTLFKGYRGSWGVLSLHRCPS